MPRVDFKQLLYDFEACIRGAWALGMPFSLVAEPKFVIHPLRVQSTKRQVHPPIPSIDTQEGHSLPLAMPFSKSRRIVRDILILVLIGLGVSRMVGITLSVPALDHVGRFSLLGPAPAPAAKLKFDYYNGFIHTTEFRFRNRPSEVMNVRVWKSQLVGPHRAKIPFLKSDLAYVSYDYPYARAALKYLFCRVDSFMLAQLGYAEAPTSLYFRYLANDQEYGFELPCHN